MEWVDFAYAAPVVVVLGLVGFFVFLLTIFRRVVPTNEVHIVQGSGVATSYGSALQNGNTYYAWPSWVPVIGVVRAILPLSVFQIEIRDYEALDSGRLPFLIDIQVFFRVSDSAKAAQRVSHFDELQEQLAAIVKGVARVVMASVDIEAILSSRSSLGAKFTEEVKDKLTSEFGVSVVGYIELLDIRDSNAKGSNVIHNIMAKKKSHIEMESRQEVAKNERNAQVAEIEAQQAIKLQEQEMIKTVGLREVETQQDIDLAKEKLEQNVKEQKRITTEKEMSIKQVESVRKAEIERQVAVVRADQDKQAEILQAEANLQSTRLEAEGVALAGKAKAEAETAILLAPVTAQTTLATAIGENVAYQEYLIQSERVTAIKEIGIKQAEALKEADIKVIANTGSAASGISSVGDILSSQGGMQVGAALEGFMNTDAGEAVMSTFFDKMQRRVSTDG